MNLHTYRTGLKVPLHCKWETETPFSSAERFCTSHTPHHHKFLVALWFYFLLWNILIYFSSYSRRGWVELLVLYIKYLDAIYFAKWINGAPRWNGLWFEDTSTSPRVFLWYFTIYSKHTIKHVATSSVRAFFCSSTRWELRPSCVSSLIQMLFHSLQNYSCRSLLRDHKSCIELSWSRWCSCRLSQSQERK